MSALRDRRDALRVSVRAGSTVLAYASDWRQFERWCDRAGRCPLPASSDSLELYVTWMFEVGRKVTTVERHVSAVSHIHRVKGLQSPVRPDVREIIRAVRRERKERPVCKAALGVEDLVRVARACDATTALGCRDQALLVLDFATSFRREELARLQLSDVAFEGRGLAVLLRYSKRDQEGKGRFVGVWAGRRASTDPVRTLRMWLQVRGDWAGPLFCRVQTGGVVVRTPISGEAVNETVKRPVARVGIDPAAYGAHSLRAGAVTASADLGRSDREIMQLSGHASVQVMQKYVRRARVFSGRNPLAGVL